VGPWACTAGSEPLFTYKWGGTERGCYVRYTFSSKVKTWSSTNSEDCDADIW